MTGTAKSRGMRYYAALLADLQKADGTAAGIAQRMGLDATALRRVLRQLHTLKFIHIGGWEGKRRGEHDAGGVLTAVWRFGKGVDVPAPLGSNGLPLTNLASSRPRLKPELMAFSEIWRLLGEVPVAIPELTEHTGVDRCAVRRLVKYLRQLELAHVADWDPEMNLAPVALYALGKRRDAPRPPRANRADRNRRDRQRRKTAGMLQATPKPFDLMASQLAGA